MQLLLQPFGIIEMIKKNFRVVKEIEGANNMQITQNRPYEKGCFSKL